MQSLNAPPLLIPLRSKLSQNSYKYVARHSGQLTFHSKSLPDSLRGKLELLQAFPPLAWALRALQLSHSGTEQDLERNFFSCHIRRWLYRYRLPTLNFFDAAVCRIAIACLVSIMICFSYSDSCTVTSLISHPWASDQNPAIPTLTYLITPWSNSRKYSKFANSPNPLWYRQYQCLLGNWCISSYASHVGMLQPVRLLKQECSDITKGMTN